METSDLISPEWWQSDTLVLAQNPQATTDTSGLRDFLESRGESGIVVPTSGSEGKGPKYVVISRAALLASARSVNRHLSATNDDRWLCALPTFHVGGIGIFARAILSGGSVSTITSKWNARDFVERCRVDEITLTSLTPTQVHDLVEGQLKCPSPLRTVIVGGGHLTDELRKSALSLGWPLLRSYGLTEASSQIATEPLEGTDESELTVLEGWELSIDDSTGCLKFRGPAACKGWAVRSPEWSWVEPTDGWILTRDRVELSPDKKQLKFISRADDQIKILGELVSLAALRSRFPEGTIIARPHPRRGFELVAFVESAEVQSAEQAVARFNATSPGYEQVSHYELIDQLPRTPLGKIAYGLLKS